MANENTKPKSKSNIKKYTLIGLGVSLVGGLGIWAYKKKGFGDKIVITQTVATKVVSTKKYLFINIPSVLQLIIIPTIKNPTNTKATLIQPYVQLRFNADDAAPFASSTVSNKTVTIESLSEKTFDPIVISINTSDVINKLPILFKSAIANRSIGLFSRTFTYLVTSVAKIPVTKDDETKVKF